MKRTIIKLSLITAFMLLVLMPCFASAEDAGFDPQDPSDARFCVHFHAGMVQEEKHSLTA